MNDFLIKYLLPAILTVAAFFALGIKKFIERSGELMAEDWHKNRKGKG